MRADIIGLCLTTAALAACSGGGGVPSTSGSGSGSTQSSSRSTDELAVTATNGVGTPLKNFSVYNESISPIASAAANGVELFALDTKGDGDSTETKLFYDAGCTQLARDTVRVFAPLSATSESVTRTTSLYSAGSSIASATRTSTDTIASAHLTATGAQFLITDWHVVH